MTEHQIKTSLVNNERETIDSVCALLKKGESSPMSYLADFIASLCNVKIDKMFSTCNEIDVAQARGLFFFSYRYMTRLSYTTIGRLTGEVYGKAFTCAAVSQSARKISSLIDIEPMWKKKWLIIKRVIKESNDTLAEPQFPITITVPKNVDVIIKKE